MRMLAQRTHLPCIRTCKFVPSISTQCHSCTKMPIDAAKLFTSRSFHHIHRNWNISSSRDGKIKTCQTSVVTKLDCTWKHNSYLNSGRSYCSSNNVRYTNNTVKRRLCLWTNSLILVPHSTARSCKLYYSGSSIYLRPGEKWQPGAIPLLDENSSRVEEIEDRLFNYLGDHTGRVQIAKFITALTSTGLRESDPRLAECLQGLSRYQPTGWLEDAEMSRFGPTIDRETFKECIAKNISLISSAFKNEFIIPDFSQFCYDIDELYWQCRDNISGNVATYIPQLARYSPNLWGVAACSVDGQRYSVGDTNVPFSLQSVSKPLTYAMVLDDLSPEVVHEYVGHEPSGVAFNTINLDYRDKPHNPMINAGAIVVCSLLKQSYNLADRFDYITQILKRLTGGEYVSFNNSVFLSERETADRNFALGYYMREKKCFPEGTNLMEVMDFYFQLCSLEITCESGAVMAATLANGGICPITGDKVFSSSSIRDTMSLMLTCGMYDYSGEFAFKVGLPGKSGVSGGIMLVVPNKMGFFVWSPALDKWGNSVRGVQFAKDLVGKFNFHHYDNLKFTQKKVDPCQKKIESRSTEVVNLLFSAFNSDVSALRRYALSGLDMDQADYDGRTALHIGAAEGHESVVRFLIDKCKCNPFVVDRWGFTPVADAKRFKHDKVVTLLEDAMENFNADEKIDRRFQAIDSTKYGEITFKRDDAFSADQQMKVDEIKYVDDQDVVYNIDTLDVDLENQHVLVEDIEMGKDEANLGEQYKKKQDVELHVEKDIEIDRKEENVDNVNKNDGYGTDSGKVL